MSSRAVNGPVNFMERYQKENVMLAIVIGMLFVIFGFVGLFFWWSSFMVIVKGLFPILFLCGGLLSVIAGVTRIRDTMDSRPETEPAKDPGQNTSAQ
jgi:uncharacterized membrane protein